jgi:hypothetical protein
MLPFARRIDFIGKMPCLVVQSLSKKFFDQSTFYGGTTILGTTYAICDGLNYFIEIVGELYGSTNHSNSYQRIWW